MATYQRIEIVEARQYDGPKTVVVSDTFGEQTAVKGDWLIGTEPRKVHVVSAAKFEAYQPYTPTPCDEQLAAARSQIDELKALNDSLTASGVGIAENLAHANAEIAELRAQITDQAEIKAQVESLSASLAAEQAKSADLQSHHDALVAAEQAKAQAQAALEAAQASVADTLNK